MVVGIVFLTLVVLAPLSWAQPLSMGKIGLQGNASVKAGKGLVFQTPKDAEAPLMNGSVIRTRKDGKALIDWTDKGSMVLDPNSSAIVTEKGFVLKSGKMVIRLNPGQTLSVKVAGKIYVVKAAAGKAAMATIAFNGTTVSTTGAIAMAGGAAFASSVPAYVGPALLAGATVGGVAAVAASESNKGGGPASSSTP